METQSKSNSGLDLPVLKKGSFYFIKKDDASFILEDRTKRGLGIKEQSVDDITKVLADKGMIHDLDGIGHIVIIRWFFPMTSHTINDVISIAESLEDKYTKLRELTCPDDST